MPSLCLFDIFFIVTFSILYHYFFLRSCLKKQTAQKRSRLQGEFIHHYEQEDGEEKEEQSVASWKRYKCPVLGCSKRYLIKR